MQIFEFELIDPTVTAPEAAMAPILAFARGAGREQTPRYVAPLGMPVATFSSTRPSATVLELNQPLRRLHRRQAGLA